MPWRFVFILIGVVLIILSAFWSPATPRRPISLWNLGWGFVLIGALLVGDAAVTS